MKTVIAILCIATLSSTAFSQSSCPPDNNIPGSCPDIISSNPNVSLPNPSGPKFMGCSTGGYLKTDGRYNCHQYVRAAVEGKVDNTSGYPLSSTDECRFYTTYCQQTIRADQNFLKVNLKADAVALACIGNNADHSAFIRSDGSYTSTPNGGSPYITPSTFELNCSNGGTAWEYYAYIKDVTLQGTTGLYLSYPTTTFSLRKNGSSTLPSYLEYSSSNWEYDPYYWEFVSFNPTNKSITLKALRTTPSSGSTKVTYKLITQSTNPGYHPTRSKDVKIYPSCEGKLDGGFMGTFNSVCGSKEHVVTMDHVAPWTWVKTSGSPSYWFTSNSGQKLTFRITSGCVTFNGYNSGCNVTRTFCASSCLTTMMEYQLLDVRTNRIIKTGTFSEEDGVESATQGLPAGMYVLISGKKRTKIVVTE